MLPAIISERQQQLEALCRRHHVRRLELFGSAATGEWDAERSDLDFLVKFDSEARFSTHGELEAALRDLFGRDVDLISDVEFTNPYFRQSVKDSRTHLWGERRQASSRNGVRVSSDRALKYLWEIRQEADYLHGVGTNVSFDEMMSSDDLIRSVPQALTRIGESLNRLSRQDKATAERITDYQGYVGQRNLLVHQYTNIDWAKVWQTVREELPLLIREVDALMAELDSEAEAE